MSFKAKTFQQAIALVSSESKKAKQFLKDKRLTQPEKTILSCFLELRNNEFELILDQLNKLKCQDPFVESQRLFCLANAYNNLSRFNEAKKMFQESVDLNQFEETIANRKTTIYSLFICASNDRDEKVMQKAMQDLRILGIVSEKDQIMNGMTEFYWNSFINNKSATELSIKHLEQLENFMNEHQVIAFLLECFDFYIKHEELNRAGSIFEKLKDHRKFKSAIMMKYIRALYTFLAHDEAIYLYENDFKEYPLFKLQFRCIKSLETGDMQTALGAWNELKKAFPNFYSDEFECLGDKTIFSLSVKKILTQNHRHQFVMTECETKEEKFLQLFLKNPTPLSKEEIYFQLWGSQIESKQDLDKLFKVVSRVRKSYGVDVKTVKGSYQILPKKAS